MRRALVAACALGLTAGCAPDGAREQPVRADSVPTVPSADSASTVRTHDDFGAVIPVDDTHAARVVSLNPTATEIIFALGQGTRLVGRSAWDEFPPEARLVPSLGNGIRPNIEAVLAANPTLVVLYATAENRPAAEAFARAGIPTISLKVDRIAQFVELTHILGRALDATVAAHEVVDSVTRTLDSVRAVVRDQPRPSVAWPLWVSPVMVVGAGSYLDELLDIAGARNVFHDAAAPSPQVSIEEIARRDPRFVLVGNSTSSQLPASAAWRAVDAVRAGRLLRIDPALTGRPSVNLGMAAVHLARLLHPELAARLP